VKTLPGYPLTMRKTSPTLYSAAIVLVVMSVLVAGCSSNGSESTSTGQGDGVAQQSTENQSGGDKKSGNSTEVAGEAGSYVDYSSELVSSTPGDKLLFFHAPWCSQCQDLEADIETSELPKGVTVFKVDYDSNQDLRQKYGVTIQTTVVKVDDQGEEIDSFIAYEEPTFDSVANALLK